MTLCPSPVEESCASVGDSDYEQRSRRECFAFKRQLERMFPPPEGARLCVKSFPHDFGSYREVCVKYDEDDPAAFDYAFRLESGMPSHWDEIARNELFPLPDTPVQP
jgi:hypothetical protein